MPTIKTKRSKRKAARKEDKQRRLERALDESLEETFPASDAVALTEPASTGPDKNRE